MRLQVLLNQLRKREGCHLDAINKAFAINGRFFDAVSAWKTAAAITCFHSRDYQTGTGTSAGGKKYGKYVCCGSGG